MTMRINDLSPPKGSKKKGKRVGRGPGSGHGKTSCRGHKGQKSRSGGSIPPGFEGGQMPLQRRLPKRGFTNIFRKSYAIINVEDLKRFNEKSQVDAESLIEAGLIKEVKSGIKLLGDGDIAFPVHIKVHKASRSAIKKIEAAGGKVEIL
jgi:large subunit ribosomal protein L15